MLTIASKTFLALMDVLYAVAKKIALGAFLFGAGLVLFIVGITHLFVR